MIPICTVLTTSPSFFEIEKQIRIPSLSTGYLLLLIYYQLFASILGARPVNLQSLTGERGRWYFPTPQAHRTFSPNERSRPGRYGGQTVRFVPFRAFIS